MINVTNLNGEYCILMNVYSVKNCDEGIFIYFFTALSWYTSQTFTVTVSKNTRGVIVRF